jgi:hypothetical protein
LFDVTFAVCVYHLFVVCFIVLRMLATCSGLPNFVRFTVWIVFGGVWEAGRVVSTQKTKRKFARLLCW